MTWDYKIKDLFNLDRSKIYFSNTYLVHNVIQLLVYFVSKVKFTNALKTSHNNDFDLTKVINLI